MNYNKYFKTILLVVSFFLFLTVMPVNAATLKLINHSFVKIVTDEGAVIYIDPYAVDATDDPADIVLITHEHGDHNELQRIQQKSTCHVIRSADALIEGVYQEFSVDDVHIQAVPAYDNDFHPKAYCVGYVLTFDDIKVYHTGDTGKIDEFADLAAMNIDYALLPIDGIYTMTPEEAVEAAAMIQATHDIPIHTMPPPDTYNTDQVALFTSPNKLEVPHGTTIQLEQSSTSVESGPVYIEGYALEQNYPNPFNPETFITFSVDRTGDFAELVIFDILGHKVKTLFNGPATQREMSILWNGMNAIGEKMPSGVYFATLKSNQYVHTIKLTMVD